MAQEVPHKEPILSTTGKAIMSQEQNSVPGWMNPLQIFSTGVLFAAGILFYGAFMLANPAYVGACLVGGIAVTIAGVIGWLTSLRLKKLEARLNRLEAALQTPVPGKGDIVDSQRRTNGCS